MLTGNEKVAIYLEGALDKRDGKLGHGMLRFAKYPICCVIDSNFAGQTVSDVTTIPSQCPVVGSLDDAKQLGAEVLALGVAPSGGRIPDSWRHVINAAVESGLCIMNGLHEALAPQYPELNKEQWIWDIRQEPKDLSIGSGACARLPNRRILFIGTDMSCGKMTAGLLLNEALQERNFLSSFVATGQVAISICGDGIPLDAIRIDYAAGAVEKMVMTKRQQDFIIIEGQGSLLHPGSSATLPLLRGSCPTHFVLCHKADASSISNHPEISIPNLKQFAELYAELASCCGTFPKPKTFAVVLNTASLNAEDARAAISRFSQETGLPCTDPVRFGSQSLVESLLESD